MVLTALQTDSLGELCSKEQLELLDAIDRLRLQGINQYISLPQIIVCGDQSSGKSSVLEAISGVSFPVKSNLCTRFPTELVLRRGQHVESSVSIVPDDSRGEPERIALAGFHQRLEGVDRLADVVENAKAAMGISSLQGRAFSKDLLRVEISGPDRPHLTIVDLPGLIHSETKHQTHADVEMIQEVVKKYMDQSRSVILAVVSAKNDFANQVVLKLARAADPTGNRTFGVITKPDTLIAGSPSETIYISLAMNQEVEFRLGWHVLKNLDSEKGVSTLSRRNADEREFFSTGVWKDISESVLGISKLRPRLSEVLLRQIAAELPSLIGEIDNKFKNCHKQLEKLGQPRNTLDEQRLYLVQVSQSFHSLVKTSINGTYSDPFFENPESERGYKQRIRAVVQNMNQDFAIDIARRGHSRQITESGGGEKVSSKVTRISRDEYIDRIQNLMRRTRGRQLPGTFDPMIVDTLFREQSRPWDGILQHHLQRVWNAAGDFLGFIVKHITDVTASDVLIREVFKPALNTILEKLKQKSGELVGPHRHGHPITYNHYFTETLANLRMEREKSRVRSIFSKFFNLAANTDPTPHISQQVNLDELAALFANHGEPDMDRFAASEALDCMNAYYKVALKRFIDDVAVELVETQLIAALVNILSPISVYQMSAELVALIAGETEGNKAKRAQLQKQIDVLRLGSDTCKRFTSIRLGAHCPSGPDLTLTPIPSVVDDLEDYADASSHTSCERGNSFS